MTTRTGPARTRPRRRRSVEVHKIRVGRRVYRMVLAWDFLLAVARLGMKRVVTPGGLMTTVVGGKWYVDAGVMDALEKSAAGLETRERAAAAAERKAG